MGVRVVDPGRSRIVLVGSPVYDDPDLVDVPQVGRNVADLAAVFTDPEVGGFLPQHCVVVDPDSSVEQVGDVLEQAAAQAEDLLLFYFAGHGLVGPRRELYLCLRTTRFRNPGYSALRFETVRDTFLEQGAGAANRVVILDSCFSGRAIGPTLAGLETDTLADGLEIGGTYTLTSASPNSVALVRQGEVHTAFTGRLIELLRDGDERAGELLTLGQIYRRLHSRLGSEGLPTPQQRGTATADLLGLVRNRRPAPPQPIALTDEILMLLGSGSPHGRMAAVAELGGWLADADPRRVVSARQALQQIAQRDNPQVAEAAQQLLMAVASTSASISPSTSTSASPSAVAASATSRPRQDELPPVPVAGPAGPGRLAGPPNIDLRPLTVRASRLLDEAEAATSTVASRVMRARSYLVIARAVTASDPQRATRLCALAEDVAGRMTRFERAPILADIAQVVAAIDPDRAMRLIDRAEQSAAKSRADRTVKARLLALIAQTLAAGHPDRARQIFDRAERFATKLWLTEPSDKSRLLNWIARAMAASDPDRAEQLATRTAAWLGGMAESETLVVLAGVVAASDPGRAERIAVRVGNSAERAQALAEVARVVAESAPGLAARLFDEADQLARDDHTRTLIATALAASAPDRAVDMASELTSPAAKETALSQVAQVLAHSDPERAAGIANQIPRTVKRERVLSQIAQALASRDPDRAEGIAIRISDTTLREQALVGIARIWLQGS